MCLYTYYGPVPQHTPDKHVLLPHCKPYPKCSAKLALLLKIYAIGGPLMHSFLTLARTCTRIGGGCLIRAGHLIYGGFLIHGGHLVHFGCLIDSYVFHSDY